MTKDRRVGLQCLLLVAAGPFLLFPTALPIVTRTALIVLAVFHLVVMGRERSLGLVSPLQWPVLLLLGMALYGYAVSSSPDALPKVLGVVLGVLVLRAMLSACRRQFHEWAAVALYLVTGAGFLAMGLVSSSVPVIKWHATAEIVGSLPRVALRLPGAEMGVNPNALGVTTLFFLPLLVAATVALWATPRASVSARVLIPLRHAVVYWSARVAVVLALLSFAGVLVLTQSRTSVIAAALVTLLILFFSGQRLTRAVAAIAAAAVVAGTVWLGPMRLVHAVTESLRVSLSNPAPGQVVPLDTRAAIWSRALHSIQDAPLGGIGLSGFREAVQKPYSGFGSNVWISHAHNTFLQVALDTGLIGLIAYVAILLLAGFMAVQVARFGTAIDRILVLGIGGNLLAVHLFGLYDAVALGAKVALFLWWSLGILAVVHRRVATRLAGPGGA